MEFFIRWIMPVSFLGIGIAILSGVVLKELPAGSGLRTVSGVVVILLGAHRFVASRMKVSTKVRRRFGGERSFPWEDQSRES